MLHVTNGESAAAGLRATGIGGDVLCWNDVLHEGPVPQTSSDGLRSIRARFLSGWGHDYERVLRSLTDRDARLARGAGREEVVLWFEHDLYDQLQLLQVLDQLASAAADWRRVHLICGNEYLGPSPPARLRERFPLRTRVTDDLLAAAQQAWAAFRAPEPTALAALANEHYPTLPFLAPALKRHLEQLPSTSNGLSRSEQQALDTIAAGAGTVREAFVESQRHEDPLFLGDDVFADYLEDLSKGASPLVSLAGDGPVLDREVRLTEAGQQVRTGAADRVRLNGIDRWLGGVHLQSGERVWRWNKEKGEVVSGKW